MSNNVQSLAKDLTKEPPRSPRAKIGGYVIAARAVDKCRAVLADSAGEYHSGCPLDNYFLDFAGISYEDFRAKVAEGANDDEIGEWIQSRSQKDKIEIIKWNNEWLYKRLSEMPDQIQEFMESYMEDVIPKDKIVYHFFDIYDIEEGRL